MKKNNKKKVTLDLEILELESKIAPKLCADSNGDGRADYNGAEC